MLDSGRGQTASQPPASQRQPASQPAGTRRTASQLAGCTAGTSSTALVSADPQGQEKAISPSTGLCPAALLDSIGCQGSTRLVVVCFRLVQSSLTDVCRTCPVYGANIGTNKAAAKTDKGTWLSPRSKQKCQQCSEG